MGGELSVECNSWSEQPDFEGNAIIPWVEEMVNSSSCWERLSSTQGPKEVCPCQRGGLQEVQIECCKSDVSVCRKTVNEGHAEGH